MTTQQQAQRPTQPFVERLIRAVDEQLRAESARLDGHGRHKLKRPSTPLFTQVANPSRVRSSEDLFVDRIRAALD
jgi:hypothetical protein